MTIKNIMDPDIFNLGIQERYGDEFAAQLMPSGKDITPDEKSIEETDKVFSIIIKKDYSVGFPSI